MKENTRPLVSDSEQETETCFSCLETNSPGTHFCEHCGTPLTSYATIAPFEHLFAFGDFIRKATQPSRWSLPVRVFVFSNNYGEYCFSLMAGDPDKSIGLVVGSTGQAHLGARFRNATGVTLSCFTLSYVAEQWRKGAVSSNDQVMPFSYSLDANSLTSGTFVRATALDMHSINDGDGVAAAMNGNAASNRQYIISTVSGISWLPDQELWIRWSGIPYAFFSAHGGT